MTDQEKKVLEEYAAFVNKTVSEVMRDTFFDMLEDEYDIKCAEEAYELFTKNPKTMSSEEVMKRYAL